MQAYVLGMKRFSMILSFGRDQGEFPAQACYSNFLTRRTDILASLGVVTCPVFIFLYFYFYDFHLSGFCRHMPGMFPSLSKKMKVKKLGFKSATFKLLTSVYERNEELVYQRLIFFSCLETLFFLVMLDIFLCFYDYRCQ